jgi:hydroxypyruvate isomerase
MADVLKFSFADWCFLKPDMDPAAYYARARAIGYTAAEMVAPANRDAARAAGLDILNMAGVRGRMNRADHRDEVIAQTRTSIQQAADAGVPQLIVFSGNREGQDPLVGRRNCIEVLRAVAPDAQRAGVTLTLEVFNTFDHADYDADSGAYAFEVISAVNSPSVKVLYDIYHMHRMGLDVTTEVTQNLSAIAHLHVAGSPGRDFPGALQSLDYAPVVRAVHDAGYRGYWGMEFRPKDDPLGELERAIDLFRTFVD